MSLQHAETPHETAPRAASGGAGAHLSRLRAQPFRGTAASALVLAACLGAACGDDGGPEPADDDTPPAAITCTAPEGHDGSPETIEELVALVDALPRPVTLPCLLQVLDRPLLVEATSNTFSAQPAGPDDPRLFLFRGDLILSVVAGGGAQDLLEMSYRRSPDRSVKGELLFPIEGELPPSAPYDRVAYSDGHGTKCWPCHGEETVDPLVTHALAFESLIVPAQQATLVDLASVRAGYESCDPAEDPQRCAILDALFDHGEVRHLSFDAW